MTTLASGLYVASKFVPFDGALYFIAGNANGGGLWKTDGTLAGTKIVEHLTYVGFGAPITVADGQLYFLLGDADLWASDGSTAGTRKIKRVFDRSTGFYTAEPFLVAVGDRVFFAGADQKHGEELWISDGTSAGTGLVKDIWPGGQSSLIFFGAADPDAYPPTYITDTAVFGNAIYFFANDGTNGYRLWKSDGTEKGTVVVPTRPPGENPLFASSADEITRRVRLMLAGSTLYFGASDPLHGEELWQLPL
jgi:ELWxxDGT repeat protein